MSNRFTRSSPDELVPCATSQCFNLISPPLSRAVNQNLGVHALIPKIFVVEKAMKVNGNLKRGFTLVELLVVITIIGTLVG